MNAWVSDLNAIRGTIVSMAPEPVNLIHFNGLIPNLAMVTGTVHPWNTLLRKDGFKLFCLGESTGTDTGSTKALLSHSDTLTFLKSLPPPVRILVFKPSVAIEEIAVQNGFRMLNSAANPARRLENKLNLTDLATHAGVPFIPYQTACFRDNLTAEFTSIPESGLIVQTAKGFAGNRTFCVRTKTHFTILSELFSGRRFRWAPMLPGTTWTANGCVDKDGRCVTSSAFKQITSEQPGVHGMPNTIGSRGNIWSPAPHPINQRIQQWMQQLGRSMSDKGFTGVFGADFQAPASQSPRLLLVEVNPRIVASIPILTPIECRSGHPPLIARHILAVTGSPVDTAIPVATPQTGGQLILRWGDNPANPIRDHIEPGVYQWKNRTFADGSHGYSVPMQDSRAVLIWKSMRPAQRGNEWCRIVTRDSIVLQEIIQILHTGSSSTQE